MPVSSVPVSSVPASPVPASPGPVITDRREGVGALEAARAVAPAVAAGRAWGEEHARLAPEVVVALAGAGLFRLVAPREVGGWEASLPVQLEVFEELGAADPSAAWCVSNAGVAGRAAASLADEARAMVFGDPSAAFSFSNLMTGTAGAEAGGYRLSGRWPVVSGAAHAAWVVLGARIDADHDQVRWMLVPAADLTVEPTWANASAMRGSGSHTVVVDGAFVPDVLAHSWDRPLRADRPLYRLRHTSVTATTSAAISLGVLRAALDHLTITLAGYRSSLDDAAPRDWPNVQLTVAELTAAHRAAWAGLLAAATDVWDAASAGSSVPAVLPAEPVEPVPPALRAALFAAADHAVQTSLAGVSRAFVCGAGGVLQRGDLLEQSLRDAHGMAVNWERIRRMIFDSGAVLLGAAPRFRAM